LPTRFPSRPDVDIFGKNVPSREVGGDYYDVLEQDRHSILIAVADVSGKGVPAALMASMLQASLRTLSSTERRVGRIMQHLNAMVCESSSSDQFATFFLARLDLTRMRLTYANAGHNFPIISRCGGAASFLDHSDLILGVVPELEYGEVSVDLSPGDRVLLFTDGISEAEVRFPDGRADQLGDDGLLEMVHAISQPASALGMVDSIHAQVMAMVQTEIESDDMTLVALLVGKPESVPLSAIPQVG
jgi:sigma-B regulation protein RsbU (phosphoserine phosphatase)